MSASTLELPSDRSFGLTMGGVCLLIGGMGSWKGAAWAMGMLAASAVLFVLGLVAPRVLHPLNVAWMRLAAVLNLVVSPIVLAVVFYGIVTPYAAVTRLVGRDALRRRFERDRDTYWIPRDPPGPDAGSFRRQY